MPGRSAEAVFQYALNTLYGSPCLVSTCQGSRSKAPLKLSACSPSARNARLIAASRASIAGS